MLKYAKKKKDHLLHNISNTCFYQIPEYMRISLLRRGTLIGPRLPCKTCTLVSHAICFETDTVEDQLNSV